MYLTGWMLRIKLTLFKALVMSLLDYGLQLWSSYLINRKLRKFKGLSQDSSLVGGLSCPERLTSLKLYSLQHRKDIIIYVWKILEGLAPNIFPF